MNTAPIATPRGSGRRAAAAPRVTTQGHKVPGKPRPAWATGRGDFNRSERMKFGSVCSGIEAASVAWHPLGWQTAWVSEIERFPCSVLAHRFPGVPNRGDMTKFKDWPDEPIDLLVGGTPCQSFSVAGLRKGLADPRGNLMLTFGAIASRFCARWLVWENVPGVLSSNGGRDFGTFLGMLAELGYGFAYRVLDAQFFGVAQRRRRVFVVGHLGDWRPADPRFEAHLGRDFDWISPIQGKRTMTIKKDAYSAIFAAERGEK